MVQEGGRIELFLQELDKAFDPVVKQVEEIMWIFSKFSQDIERSQANLKTIANQMETLFKEKVNPKLRSTREFLASVALQEVEMEITEHMKEFRLLTQGLFLASLNLSIRAQNTEGTQRRVLAKLGEEMASFLIGLRKKVEVTQKLLQDYYKKLELLISSLSKETSALSLDELKMMVHYIGELGRPSVEELIVHSQFHDILRQEVEKLMSLWKQLCKESNGSLYELGKRAALFEKLPENIERVSRLVDEKLNALRDALKSVNYSLRTYCHTSLGKVYKMQELANSVKMKVKELMDRIRRLKFEMPEEKGGLKQSFKREVIFLQALWTQFAINNGDRDYDEYGTLDLVKELNTNLKEADEKIAVVVKKWESVIDSVWEIVEELDVELQEAYRKLVEHTEEALGSLERAKEDLVHLSGECFRMTRQCLKHIEDARREFRWGALMLLQQLRREREQFERRILDVRDREEFLQGFNAVSVTPVLAGEEVQSSIELF